MWTWFSLDVRFKHDLQMEVKLYLEISNYLKGQISKFRKWNSPAFNEGEGGYHQTVSKLGLWVSRYPAAKGNYSMTMKLHIMLMQRNVIKNLFKD